MFKFLGNINGVVRFQPLFYNNSISRPIQLYSTSTLIPTEDSPSFPNYLVESLGFSELQSLSISSKLSQSRAGSKVVSNFHFAENAHSVINFFKDYGFNQSQIKSLVSYDPRILTANVDKTLIPKLKFLQNEGFSGTVLSQIVCCNPVIFKTGLESCILPTIHALKEILGCDSHVISILLKPTWIVFSTVSKNLVKNVGLLKSYGIPIEMIRKRLMINPRPFLFDCKNLEGFVIRVEQKLGIPRSSPLFLYGLHVLSGLSEKTMDSKVELFKSFGWLESDISVLCRTSPMSLAFSETAIKKKLGFLVHELGLKPTYIVSNFRLLNCSLEKRVMPRHKILVALKDKGLTKATHHLGQVVRLTETQCLSKFVLPFKEVHQVYTELTGIAVVQPDDVA